MGTLHGHHGGRYRGEGFLLEAVLFAERENRWTPLRSFRKPGASSTIFPPRLWRRCRARLRGLLTLLRFAICQATPTNIPALPPCTARRPSSKLSSNATKKFLSASWKLRSPYKKRNYAPTSKRCLRVCARSRRTGANQNRIVLCCPQSHPTI